VERSEVSPSENDLAVSFPLCESRRDVRDSCPRKLTVAVAMMLEWSEA